MKKKYIRNLKLKVIVDFLENGNKEMWIYDYEDGNAIRWIPRADLLIKPFNMQGVLDYVYSLWSEKDDTSWLHAEIVELIWDDVKINLPIFARKGKGENASKKTSE